MRSAKTCSTCKYNGLNNDICLSCRLTHSPDDMMSYEILWESADMAQKKEAWEAHKGCKDCVNKDLSALVEPCAKCYGTNDELPDLWEQSPAVVVPPYYDRQCSLECADVMKLVMGVEGYVHFCLGNILKYLWRYKNKNGAEDLKKCERYIRMLEDEHVTSELFESLESLYRKVKNGK